LYPSRVFDTTVNSQFHILYWILKCHFDKPNQDVSGVANLIIAYFNYKFKWSHGTLLFIICFKIKNPPPVELCWQKKEIPRKSLFFLGWLNLPQKFDIELLSLFTKHKIIIMYKKVLATVSYFLSEIIKWE
jgi:hypothetical protein